MAAMFNRLRLIYQRNVCIVNYDCAYVHKQYSGSGELEAVEVGASGVFQLVTYDVPKPSS